MEKVEIADDYCVGVPIFCVISEQFVSWSILGTHRSLSTLGNHTNIRCHLYKFTIKRQKLPYLGNLSVGCEILCSEVNIGICSILSIDFYYVTCAKGEDRNCHFGGGGWQDMENVTCNIPYFSSISRNRYSLACSAFGVAPGGGVHWEAPVLGGPVIPPPDSWPEEQRKRYEKFYYDTTLFRYC